MTTTTGTYKVGRWEYPAERHDDTGDIEYVINGETRWGIDQAKFTPAATYRDPAADCTHPMGGMGEDNRCPTCDTRVGWGRLALLGVPFEVPEGVV
jgi:hypothetical protein